MMMMLALFLLLITRGSALSGRFVRQPEPGTAGSPLSPAIEVTATPAANLTGALTLCQNCSIDLHRFAVFSAVRPACN